MKRFIQLEFEPTPKELAEEFMALDAKDQARFFSECQRVAYTWDKPSGWCFQMAFVEQYLCPDGKAFCETIADHMRKD